MNKTLTYLFILATAFTLSGCVFGVPGEGDKVGQIAKVEALGLVCKVPVILITGKFGGGELYAAIRTEDRELLKKAKHFNDTQEQVKVFYHVEFIEGVCDAGAGAGTAFVDDIVAWSEGE